MRDTGKLGSIGEDAACAILEEQGFEVLARNWRSRAGEIDVIAYKGGTLAFVEVKSRTSTAFGEPEESVTELKARRIRSLAAEYLSGSDVHGEIRFDVIAVMLDRSGKVLEVRHTPDAF